MKSGLVLVGKCALSGDSEVKPTRVEKCLDLIFFKYLMSLCKSFGVRSKRGVQQVHVYVIPCVEK